MKKVFYVVLAAAAAVALLNAPAYAQTSTKSFTVSAEVPAANGFGITAFEVDSTSGQFTLVNGLTLDFDVLDFDTQNEIYLPDHFFAIDVAPTGGAGNPNVTAVYTEGNNPNSSTGGNGLGHKSTITFVKVAGGGETGIGSTPKIRLIDSVGTSGSGAISKSQLVGGFLRMYVGVVTFDQSATFPDPGNAEAFTNADQPGVYDGTLVITATAT